MQARLSASFTPINRALRYALFGAALGLVATPTTLLAAEPGGTASVKRYSIAPGALADAINQFARAAGITLAATPQQTAGKTSPGLQGEFAVHDGLNRLLRGTDLEALNQGNGSFILGKRLTMELGAIAISSTGLDGTTEGSGSYTIGVVSLGKTPQSLRHTPQSVTVMTEQRMKDQNLTDLKQMLKQIPGVVVDYTDSERVNYYARGYQIDAIQFDGATFSPNAGWGNFIQPDTETLDHIEVLRGASGMLRGAGNPSGTVNMLRKRPTQEFQGTASYTTGSWNANRYTADISGPLVEGGVIRGRVIAVHDDKDFFQDVKMERKNVLYTVLAADLGERTTVTAGLEFTELDATGSWGNLPDNLDGSPMDFSRSTFLGADWARWDRTNLHMFTELEHRFDNDWNLKLNAARARFSYKDHGFQQTYMYRAGTDPYLFAVSSTISDGGGRTLTDNLQATLDGPFQLFGREHHLSLGAERNKIDHIGVESGYTDAVIIDIREWNSSTFPRPSVIYGDPTASEIIQNATYATGSFSLGDALTLLIGARLNWYDYASNTNTDGYSVDQHVVPYVALVYDLTDQISAYASYTEIFAPQEAYSTSGLLDPMTGEVYEVGLKGEFQEGRLNSSVALFRTNMIGQALQDTSAGDITCPPNNAINSCMIAAGKSRSEGFEIEISGQVLPGWQLAGGYTYTQTKILKQAEDTASNALRSNDPKHLLKLFTSYKLPGRLSAWTVGGGVQAQSDIYAVTGSTRSEQAGYAIYNAMIGYRFNGHYSVQLNANNLFDKYYYEKVGSYGNYYYGEPRNFALTLRGDF